MYRNLLLAIALAAAPLFWPFGASAGVIAEYSINGGASFLPICSAPSGNPCSATLTDPTTGVLFQVQAADSNSPGTPTLGELLSSAVHITNTSATSASIVLRFDDIGFTSPAGTVSLESAIGTTVTVVGTGADTLSYISCLDPGNHQNTCPGSGSPVAPVVGTTAVTPNIGAVGSSNQFDSTLTPTGAGPYSLGERMDLTLGAGGQFNYSASTETVPQVPEPISVSVLGVGLLGLFGACRRRRRG